VAAASAGRRKPGAPHGDLFVQPVVNRVMPIVREHYSSGRRPKCKSYRQLDFSDLDRVED
jgi:hypothetical protein